MARPPGVPAGTIAVMRVSVLVLTVARAPPIVTDLRFASAVPLITTVEPPALLPDEGDTVVIVGTPTYVYPFDMVAVPDGAIT
ncbi:unannotated protein [freshwater metagenome]|uniref:Unannotated protein n=1 Tax=freshwater metagenome TaxID=449393 RepID=A0A6J6CQ59_9ZZZZ